jgi:hypothetical protein
MFVERLNSDENSNMQDGPHISDLSPHHYSDRMVHEWLAYNIRQFNSLANSGGVEKQQSVQATMELYSHMHMVRLSCQVVIIVTTSVKIRERVGLRRKFLDDLWS